MKLIGKSKYYLKKLIFPMLEAIIGDFYFKCKGFCPCCDKQVEFVSHNSWLRDFFKCNNCGSIPRERALMLTIEKYYPNWKQLKIHESSPNNRGHSQKLRRLAKYYKETQFYPNEQLGALVKNVQNENLECQTFDDSSFDLVITSDVMEHIYNPEMAFREIHRTLKSGGAHIFSVPLVNKFNPTQRWAKKGEDDSPVFLYEPEWHGNPINKKGSPVTMHWGYDIVEFIKEYVDADTKIEYINNLDFGVRAEYIEIVVAKKKNNE
ncbi:class I SAM-dependent methyltransferase [Seonamhaeicola aphaedonensis]|uniref:Methyltransferase family protein n=1 Tax=Seonamhaeicola aphaedonensis TaxID=1461338 RepID=A0A3D9HFV9_9FLAO|nr:class I SAM-dependent methyltransferase [Seonamhaeicola aphaedonensis]RED48367.1 methyltransferase family protein [Seonamhaeicola aphaedonensis]